MKFYDELGKVYEIVFPMDENTVNFLLRDVHGARVLDIACATGDYSINIADRGFKVDAVDLNKDMIEGARRKSQGLNVNFQEGDMTKIRDIFKDSRYDLAFCIGNSIVHLNSKEKIGEFIKTIYHMLNESGVLVIQTVNYDRIITNNITALPAINREDKGVNFIRKYFYNKEEDIIDFNTELIIKREGREERFENSIPLIPLMSYELEAMIKEAGFSDYKLFGGFDGRDFSLDSFATIIRAVK